MTATHSDPGLGLMENMTTVLVVNPVQEMNERLSQPDHSSEKQYCLYTVWYYCVPHRSSDLSIID